MSDWDWPDVDIASTDDLIEDSQNATGWWRGLRMRNLVRAALALFVLQTPSSCAPELGRRASVSVQVCMTDPNDADAFLTEIRDASQRAKLNFQDSSQEAADMIAEAQARGGDLSLSTGRSIEFQAFRSEFGVAKFGVMGGNLALPENQVAVGFFYGDDKAESQRFASDLIRRLSLRWDVEPIPDTRGAFPKKKCNPPSLVAL